MLEFKNVKYLDILDIDYLKISDGEVTCIIGPSGSGKSTLLKLINKLIPPTEGSIYYNGTDIDKINSVEYRCEVPMLSQSPVLFNGTVRDNLLIGRKFQKSDLLDDSILKNALKNVDLDVDLDEDISNLSGGEGQRVSIARLMLLDSKVYLLDEPSSALDDITEDYVIKTIVDMAREKGKSVIYVTHSNSLSDKYSDRLIKIVDGRIVNE